MKAESEPDDFLNGLSLGIWDEEFGYYRTADEIKMTSSPEPTALHKQGGTFPSIISNVVEVEFNEPEVTNNNDMKSGDW